MRWYPLRCCAGWLRCLAALPGCAAWLNCAEKLNDAVISSAVLRWLAAKPFSNEEDEEARARARFDNGSLSKFAASILTIIKNCQKQYSQNHYRKLPFKTLSKNVIKKCQTIIIFPVPQYSIQCNVSFGLKRSQRGKSGMNEWIASFVLFQKMKTGKRDKVWARN